MILLFFNQCSNPQFFLIIFPASSKELKGWSYKLFICFLRLGIIYQYGRENLSKDIHLLILRTCDDFTLRGKSDFTDVINLRTCNREIILGYVGGSNMITRVLKSKRGKRKKSMRGIGDRGRMGREMQCCWLWRWKKEAWTQGRRQPLKRGKGKERDSPLELPERNTTLPTLCF